MTHRYTIRRLDAGCWIDVVEFTSDTEVKDAGEEIRRRMLCGEIAIASRKALFCIAERLPNGREHHIGKDVAVNSNGKIL